MKRGIVGENGNSSILLTNRGIRIQVKDAKANAVCPVGVVTIVPGVQVELGRGIKEFIRCLKSIRKPLAIQNIADSGVQKVWKIIRLETGNVPEVWICTIDTINEKIASVVFNQDIIYDKEYRRYQRLSCIHQLKAGKFGSANSLGTAVSRVSRITGEPIGSFRIRANRNIVTVYTNKRKLEHQVNYIFINDRYGNCRLIAVGFMPRKVKQGV